MKLSKIDYFSLLISARLFYLRGVLTSVKAYGKHEYIQRRDLFGFYSSHLLLQGFPPE